MSPTQTKQSPVSVDTSSQAKDFVLGFHGVRYQVKDVARSVEFYTRQLGFKLDHQQLPGFASVSLEKLTLLLSGPGGRQILLEDPDRNAIELFEPAR